MNKPFNFFLLAIIFFTSSCQSVESVPYLNVESLQVQNVNISTENLNSEIQSLDGKGNNIANPNWGSVNEPLMRISAADYADGISSPAGADRPSARTISNTFSINPADGIANDRDFTAFAYAWGQFLDHDIGLTEGASPKEAFPIIVPTGDVSFDPLNTGAMTIPMSRSKYDAASSPRQQINSITAFVDGSQVYGVDAARASALRELSGGRMKISAGNLLPFNTSAFANANDAHRVDDTKLFLAGDVRANENPELLSLQTLFVREHNRIADLAAQRHPEWTDEELYQFARRMVIAELQKITYEEFLPSILGANAMPEYQGYHADVNPNIATEFSTGAFRFGHSMLGSDFEFLDNDGNEIREAMLLRDAFFNPTPLGETDIDPLLKYLASDNAQEIDTKVVADVRDFLFGAPGQGGFDLAALNIQRGRDHGIADYNTIRAAYGLARVASFDEITSDPALRSSLAATYGSVDNIDLWIGGLAEDHLPNSSMGATFTRIIVDQFTRLRDGDRFWYQVSLPQDRVLDIQNTTLADVIRRNTKLTKLQADVFFFTENTTVMIETQQADPQTGQQPQSDSQGDNRNRRQPPQSAIDACANIPADSACSFIGRNNENVNGTCQTVNESQFACVPQGGRNGNGGSQRP